jgi:hypothetical protein
VKSAAHLAERSHIHGFLSVKVAHLSLKFLQCEQNCCKIGGNNMLAKQSLFLQN